MHTDTRSDPAAVINLYDHKAAFKPIAKEFQTTLNETVSFTGVGVHSGALSAIFVHPAEINTGYVFIRRIGNQMISMPAESQFVTATDMATVLSNRDGFQVSTIEHIMAALRGLKIDNAILEIDGIEIPILDGSAVEFTSAFMAAGLCIQSATRRFLRVLKPVMIDSGVQKAELWPNAEGFRVEAEIDFPSSVIGHQSIIHSLSVSSFVEEIAPARTFGFVKDLNKVQALGFALGSSLDNTIAIDDDHILNPEGLRYADEFVRHKVLDAVGDLALAGLPILGLYRVKRANHRINSEIIRALLADTSAWDIIDSNDHEHVEAQNLVSVDYSHVNA